MGDWPVKDLRLHRKISIYDWENQSIYKVNRQEPVAHFFPYESERYALIGNPEKSKFFISLNGEWNFYFSKNPNERPKEFWTLPVRILINAAT